MTVSVGAEEQELSRDQSVQFDNGGFYLTREHPRQEQRKEERVSLIKGCVS